MQTQSQNISLQADAKQRPSSSDQLRASLWNGARYSALGLAASEAYKFKTAPKKRLPVLPPGSLDELKRGATTRLHKATSILKFVNDPEHLSRVIRGEEYKFPTLSNNYKMVSTIGKGGVTNVTTAAAFIDDLDWNKGRVHDTYLQKYRIVAKPELLHGRWHVQTPMFRPWDEPIPASTSRTVENRSRYWFLPDERQTGKPTQFYTKNGLVEAGREFLDDSFVAEKLLPESKTYGIVFRPHAPSKNISIDSLRRLAFDANLAFRADYSIAREISEAGLIPDKLVLTDIPHNFTFDMKYPTGSNRVPVAHSIDGALQNMRSVLDQASDLRARNLPIMHQAEADLVDIAKHEYARLPFAKKIFTGTFYKAGDALKVAGAGAGVLGAVMTLYDIKNAMSMTDAKEKYQSLGSTAGSLLLPALASSVTRKRFGLIGGMALGLAGGLLGQIAGGRLKDTAA